MYGWRARIGHVAPSRGDTLVYEFYKMFPEGFMILNTTGTVRQLVDADFDRQRQRIEEAVQDLVENNCDSIIFSGSPLFTKLGYGSDRELGRRLTEKFAVPVAAGLTAEVEALKAMEIKKIVVGTPYGDELNQRLKRFLEASGFEVLQIAVVADINRRSRMHQVGEQNVAIEYLGVLQRGQGGIGERSGVLPDDPQREFLGELVVPSDRVWTSDGDLEKLIRVIADSIHTKRHEGAS